MTEGNKTISAKIPFREYMELLHEAQNKGVSLNQLFLSRIFPPAPEEVKMKTLLAMVIVFKATGNLTESERKVCEAFESLIKSK
jgi:hypothetical protein